MEQFTIENKLKFITFTPKIDDKTNKKIYPSLLKNWNNKDFSELSRIYKAQKESKTTGDYFLIQPSEQFIIFDTDYKEDYDKLFQVLKRLNLISENSITRSTRGDKFSYKRHFWFSSHVKLTKKSKIENIEVFTGDNCQIAEYKTTNITDILDLTQENYDIINNLLTSNKEEEPKPKTEIKLTDYDNVLVKLLDNLSSKRFENRYDWFAIYNVFLVEKLPMELFNYYSKKHYPKYNEEENKETLKNVSPNDSYSIALLYHMLKEDNLKIYNELQSKRGDFIKLISDKKNHTDLAKFIYRYKPNLYIRSSISGWYRYNEYNILKHLTTDKIPSCMLLNIASEFQNLIKEQIELNNKQFEKIPFNEYDSKSKILSKAYIQFGTSMFIKSIIDFLAPLYVVKNIDDLIDANHQLFAFDNEVYDNTTKTFRAIKTTDYISKTTKYNINKNSNPLIREEIITLIKSMFDDDELYTYHMNTIAMSMFGNSNEHFILNCGKGRNGKGVCSSLISASFGEYFYTGESTFLTTVYKADRPNPTLYNLKGVRYFLTTEPESDSDTKFNIGLVKLISGNDEITTRDLNKTNITYKPSFTTFLQCNTKPKLDNIDLAVKDRFRIIDFPFTFRANPTKPNEKLIDNTLKNKLNQTYYNEFILLLIDINNKITKLFTPKCVLNSVDKYLNSVNVVYEWFYENYKITDEKNDIISTTELFTDYSDSGMYEVITLNTFSKFFKTFNIPTKILRGKKIYYGIVKKIDDVDEYDILD